jgi:hypothetical protein
MADSPTDRSDTLGRNVPAPQAQRIGRLFVGVSQPFQRDILAQSGRSAGKDA